MRLFLDITRIAYRLTGTTPTGIDRVEFAYASRLLRDAAYKDAVGVFTAPFFTGALRRDLMLEVLDQIEQAWRLNLVAEQDPTYVSLSNYLRTPVNLERRPERRFRHGNRVKHLYNSMIYPIRDLVRSTKRLNRWLDRTKSPDLVYLNTSHNQLENQKRLAWAQRAPMRNVFFVHDTIPIDYPEYVAPMSLGRHQRRMATVSDMASLAIVNSKTTERHFAEYLQGAGLRVPPSVVVPLGVADAFLRIASDRRRAPEPDASPNPYFVTLSTIEPRKNLLFLFSVWRQLIGRLGHRTPRLVLAGARGWENENIADILDRSRDLGPYLVEVSDLCDNALAKLLRGARALLQPSSIEGFGLPLIEGLTLGLPVIASDIPAHREVGAGYVKLIDPIDGPRWLSAIEALSDQHNGLAERMRQVSLTYKPTTWGDHVEATMAAITGQPILTRL